MTLMKNNEFFEEHKRIAHDWALDLIRHDQLLERIENSFGEESVEVKTWLKENPAPERPYPAGFEAAYDAWEGSITRKEAEFDLADSLWDYEVQGFVDALRLAGISHFVYTYRCRNGHSLENMRMFKNMRMFLEAGCTPEGLCSVRRLPYGCGRRTDGEYEHVRGVRFFV